MLHLIPNLRIGGAERLVADLIKYSDRSRIKSALVSLYDASGTYLEREVVEAGATVWSLGKRRGFDFRMFRRLAIVYNAFRPQVVHTHLYVLRYLVPLIKTRASRCVYVHTVHSVAEREVDRLGRMVHWLCFKMGVVPVAIAGAVAKSLQHVYGIKRCPLIPNGISLTSFLHCESHRTAWRLAHNVDPHSIVFVCTGRLAMPKNQQLLIQAFAIVARRIPNVQLLLVGEGSDRLQLEWQTKRLGVCNKVRFLGDRQDIPFILGASDVFVLASLWEGNPLSVMEAMAAGKPVIATAVGGIPELVEDHVTGLLVPSADVHSLASAMHHLALDPTARCKMGQMGRRKALAEFDVTRTVRAYEDLYQKLLELRRTA